MPDSHQALASFTAPHPTRSTSYDLRAERPRARRLHTRELEPVIGDLVACALKRIAVTEGGAPDLHDDVGL
jgi:hypothetical protein